MKYLLSILSLLVIVNISTAQTDDDIEWEQEMEILDNGDTIFVDVLEELDVTPVAITEQENEIWKYYNKKVYTKKSKYRENFTHKSKSKFLLEGVYKRKLTTKPKILEYTAVLLTEYEMYEEETEYDLSQIKKDLSRTDTKLMIKIIEMRTGENAFDIISRLRGKGNAKLWQTVSKSYGISLKEGFRVDEYPLLNQAFEDIDINTRVNRAIEKLTSEKY